MRQTTYSLNVRLPVCLLVTVISPAFPLSARITQNRHARAGSYRTVAGIDDLTAKVSSFGTTQEMHDLRWLSHGPQRLAFKIADLIDAVGAIERLHVCIYNARR
jgi:hypothetical protein